LSYFPDLSEYGYLKGIARDPLHRNIGWLDSEHSFERGTVPEPLLAKFRKLCAARVNLTRGFHLCELCESPVRGVPAACEGGEIKLGCAEVRVGGLDGIVYVAPDLVLHYMTDHRYLPPAEFLEALRDA
jgi:hypothetical protein